MWTADKIKFILSNPAGNTLVNGKSIRNSFIIYRLLQRLYERQTADEQAYGSTVKQNGEGFTGADAPILSDIASKTAEYMQKNPNVNGLTAFYGVFSDDSRYAKLVSPKFNSREEAEQWKVNNGQRSLMTEQPTGFVKVGGQAPLVAKRLMKYVNTQLVDIAESFAASKGGEQTCEPEGYTAPAPKVRKSRKKADAAPAVQTYQCSVCLSDMQRNPATVMDNGHELVCDGCSKAREEADAARIAERAQPVSTPVDADDAEIRARVAEFKADGPESYYMDGEMSEEEAADYWYNHFKNELMKARQ